MERYRYAVAVILFSFAACFGFQADTVRALHYLFAQDSLRVIGPVHATTDTTIAADRARKLTTARIIGKSTTFDGTAAIVPDSAVSVAQSAKLITARTIGKSTTFDGTGNIVPDSSVSVVQATKLTTARTIGKSTSFDGTASILPDSCLDSKLWGGNIYGGPYVTGGPYAPTSAPTFTNTVTTDSLFASKAIRSGTKIIAGDSIVGTSARFTGTVIDSSGGYGVVSTATAGGTTTLVSGSAYYQIFTGTNTQTVVLPNATTCKIGLQYEIDNTSTGAVALQDNGATLLWTLAPRADVRAILTVNGTAAGTWNIDYFGDNVATTKVETFNNSFTFAGTDASTVNFPAAGGTIYVASNPATAVGDLIAGNSAATPAVLTKIAAGSAGTVLQGAGAATLPAYSSWTMDAPGASTTNRLASNGTNWVALASDSIGLGTALKNDTSGLGTKINANQANFRTLAQAQGYLIAGQATGTYWFGMQDSAASASGGSSRYSPVIIPWYTADHPTLNGVVSTLRVDAICCVNNTAPTATFTVGLYPVTKGAGAAGLSIWSLGTVVSGSTVVFTTPAASSITRTTSGSITIPSNGMYVLGVTTTSATIATSSLVNITAYLEQRN
jgi:hypothetical protein